MHLRSVVLALETAAAEREGNRSGFLSLARILRESGSYDDLDNDTLHYVGPSGASWTIEQVVSALIRRTLEVGAETALSELNEYQNSNEFALEHLLLLSNTYVDFCYSFPNGVKLASVTSLPDSALKRTMAIRQLGAEIGSRVRSVLSVDYRVTKHTEPQDAERITDRTSLNLELDLSKRLNDTRLILSLARNAKERLKNLRVPA